MESTNFIGTLKTAAHYHNFRLSANTVQSALPYIQICQNPNFKKWYVGKEQEIVTSTRFYHPKLVYKQAKGYAHKIFLHSIFI